MAATKSKTTKAKSPAVKKPAPKKAAPKKAVAKPKVTVKREVPSKDVLNLSTYPEEQADIDRLVALVPSQDRLDEYVHRTFEDGLSDFELFEYAHQTGQNIMLPGPTGAGKTHALKAYAAWKKIPYGWLEGSRLTRIEDVYGEYRPDPDSTEGKLKFVWGDLALILKYGGVFDIIEINMILEGVASKLFTVLDDNRSIKLTDAYGTIVKGDERTLLAASMNPGYAGTRDLNDALSRRFQITRRWRYDRAVEEQLVQSNHLLNTAARLRASTDAGTISTPIPTSTLITFEQHLYQIGEARGFDAGFAFAKACFLDQFRDDERGAVEIDFNNSITDLQDEYYALWFKTEDEVAEDEEAAEGLEVEDEVDDADDKGEERKLAGGYVAKNLTRMKSKRDGKCAACDSGFKAGTLILYGGKREGKVNVFHDTPACRPSGANIKDSRELRAAAGR